MARCQKNPAQSVGFGSSQHTTIDLRLRDEPGQPRPRVAPTSETASRHGVGGGYRITGDPQFDSGRDHHADIRTIGKRALDRDSKSCEQFIRRLETGKPDRHIENPCVKSIEHGAGCNPSHALPGEPTLHERRTQTTADDIGDENDLPPSQRQIGATSDPDPLLTCPLFPSGQRNPVR